MNRPRTRRRKRRPPGLIAPFVLTLIVIGAVLFSVYGQRGAGPLEVGEASPQRFVAPTDVQVADPVATERRRQAARAQVPEITSVDTNAQRLALSAIVATDLPDPVTDYLLERYADPAGLTAEQVDRELEAAVARAPGPLQRDVRLVLRQRLVPTAFPDPDLTHAARSAAAAAVQPVLVRLDVGETIIDVGRTVQEEHLRALEAAGLYDPRTRQLRQTAVVVLGCLLVAAALAAPASLAARALRGVVGHRQFRFLLLTILVTIALQRVAFDLVPGFLFVALIPVLAAALLGRGAALATTAWATVAVAALAPEAPLLTALVVATSGTVATFAVPTVANRTALLVAGGAAGLTAGVVGVAVHLMQGGVAPLPALIEVGVRGVGGLSAGFVALGLLSAAEGPFGFLTEYRLTELASPQSPLLQKLVVEAPGSYQHTQVIANLVEQAVQAIEGNALLARVGALYHDVGKIRRPHFFVENQSDGVNPHDRISPHLSYLIITSHVRDGIELVRQHRLPVELEPFIAEHHGTSVLAYFYKRALEDAESLDELNFRYPGPKPRTRETAVLMLADTVEAASRSLTDPNQGSIRAMIDRLFEQRLQDGQLSDSPLTFRDLEMIANSFERVLTASMHRRVRYPSDEEIKGLKHDRDSRRDGSSTRHS